MSSMFIPTLELTKNLIAEQFPYYAHLPITSVKEQGHDNRTYRLGNDYLIRLPTTADYALKVPLEQEFLPQFLPFLSTHIPQPIAMGNPSESYPYHFSIYRWLEGSSLNHCSLTITQMETLAFAIATFLKELQGIPLLNGPKPGQHNWWRGDHPSVYSANTRSQITMLKSLINHHKAQDLWERACATPMNTNPVWIHGDMSPGNILIHQNKLTGIIDFGGMGIGDPACDLVIAWTIFSGTARDIFIHRINVDDNTWLRARAWALWKATFELSRIQNKNDKKALIQQQIIEELL